MRATPCAGLLGALLSFVPNLVAQLDRPTPPGIRPLPQGRVTVQSLRARVAITDGVASTEIEQVLHNDGHTEAEADWILPLPEGATADGFTMTVGDQVMQGEVLDGGRARAIYEEIVRRRRDPGLLEYHGAGCLRARVFPVPARGEVIVKVRYRHTLQPVSGVYGWSFPLRAQVASGLAPQRVSLGVEIRSSHALKNVYSPWPGVDLRQLDDRHARLSYESSPNTPPSRDLDLYFSLTDSEFGLSLLGFQRSGEDGYALLLLSPKRDWQDAQQTRRCVQFVLDTSGSMAGRKIEQAKGALRFFLGSLAARDYFNVVPFSTEAEPFFASAAAATPEQIEVALQKVARLQARGGTNIEDALRRALSAPRPEGAADALPIVVFLTDGEPTVGDTDRASLLAKAREHNRAGSRVFVFGVGDTLDAKLLDRLAADHGGSRDYVREQEDIEVKTSALFTKLSNPVLTGLTLRSTGVELLDLHPKTLPDLFKGSQLALLCRYRGSGNTTLRLAGDMAGVRREFSYDVVFPAHSTQHDFVPTLWAERKVAQLLDAIQQNGQKPELVDEVRRLAKEFGIVTPFTSHLIVEEGARLGGLPAPQGGTDVFFLGGARQESPPGATTGSAPQPTAAGPAAAGAASRERLHKLGRADKGEAVVKDSRDLAELEREEAKTKVDQAPTRRVGARTFYNVDGRWLDSACPTDWQTKVTRVSAFSSAYFDLLRTHADLKAVFALGDRVVVRIGEQVYEIAPAE